jgi:hypothetical protein
MVVMGSKVIEIYPQVRHVTVDLSWPVIKSVMIELFLSKCASQYS